MFGKILSNELMFGLNSLSKMVFVW